LDKFIGLHGKLKNCIPSRNSFLVSVGDQRSCEKIFSWVASKVAAVEKAAAKAAKGRAKST
jgi:hypothetical protein